MVTFGMHPYLFPGLRATPRTFDYLMRQIPAGKLDEPSHSGRFTPREVIAHIADWEPILQDRLKVTLANPGSVIYGIDEGERALELEYSKLDWEQQLEMFAASRAETIRIYESLTPEQWKLTYVHKEESGINEKGPLTAEDQANMIMGHDLYHIDQLLDVLQNSK